jgi:hypothetical protein
MGMCRDPLLYKFVAKEQDETKAKPIYTQPAKIGRTPDTYFEKHHIFVSQVRNQVHDLSDFIERGSSYKI